MEGKRISFSHGQLFLSLLTFTYRTALGGHLRLQEINNLVQETKGQSIAFSQWESLKLVANLKKKESNCQGSPLKNHILRHVSVKGILWKQILVHESGLR